MQKTLRNKVRLGLGVMLAVAALGTAGTRSAAADDLDRIGMPGGESVGTDAGIHIPGGQSIGTDAGIHIPGGQSVGTDAGIHIPGGQSVGTDGGLIVNIGIPGGH